VTYVFKNTGFTRNYLSLDPPGKSFRYTSRGYVPTSFESAIEHVFEGLEELGETRSSVYNDAAFAANTRR
jgi:hypothetical protein